MNKSIIAVLMAVAFFCMYIGGSNTQIPDIIGIGIMLICATMTIFGDRRKKE